ncbi:MAG: J domain-containing protein, partial [Okeania sp. SIO2D1]|nr:J domain-containing protein [Okeania sp. SIO2D1]
DNNQNSVFDDGEVNLGRSSKDIRKLFLKLAAKFHPDKADDDHAKEHHTEIMKEINVAYKNGDFARLMEIERHIQTGNTDNISAENGPERACQQLEKEIAVLNQQLEQLKEELREVKTTPEGEMVKLYRKTEREGENFVDLALEEANTEVTMLEDIRDFVQSFRDKKITIKQFLQGPASVRMREEEELEDLIEQMFGDFITVVHR